MPRNREWLGKRLSRRSRFPWPGTRPSIRHPQAPDRSLIRLEAGVASLFGAILGVVIGIVFGWLAVIAIPDSVIDRLAVPFPTLVIYVVIATIAGLIAASLPARRASRLNVLEAIGHV